MNDHSAEIVRLHNVLYQKPVSLFNEQFLQYFRYVFIDSLKENHSVLF